MPIYEYRCPECGATSEILTGFGKDEAVSCLSCGNKKVEKIMSASSVLTRLPKRPAGKTCCGKEERCSTPPCSTGESCCKS